MQHNHKINKNQVKKLRIPKIKHNHSYNQQIISKKSKNILPTQKQVYLQFLRDNQICPYPYRPPSGYEQYAYDTQGMHKDKYTHKVKLSPDALYQLRKLFANKYKLCFSNFARNRQNITQKPSDTAITQLNKLQSQIMLNRLKIMGKQQLAQNNKKKHLKQKSNKISQILSKQSKITQKNKKQYKKSLKQSVNKIQKWHCKIENSQQRRQQILSRVSSASSIHNLRVSEMLSKHQFRQQQLIMHSATNNQHNHSKVQHSKNNHYFSAMKKYSARLQSQQTGSCSNHLQSVQSTQSIRNQQIQQNKLHKTLIKNIQKQVKIEKARKLKYQNQQQIKQHSKSRSKDLLLKSKDNIAEILRARKKRNQLLDHKYKSSRVSHLNICHTHNHNHNQNSNHQTINKGSHRTKTCNNGLLPSMKTPSKQAGAPTRIYLTESSQINTNSQPYKSNNYSHKQQSVQDLMTNYHKYASILNPQNQHNSKHSRNIYSTSGDIVQKMEQANIHGIHKPKDYAYKYQRAIVDKLRSISTIVHTSHPANTAALPTQKYSLQSNGGAAKINYSNKSKLYS